ncbi:MAG: hypothetical protein GY940_10095 [bacterium]|nr:hypothetical protein [bacterium]
MTQDTQYITLSVIGNFAGTVFSCSEKIDPKELDGNEALLVEVFAALETDMVEKARAKGITGTPEIQQNIRVERDIDRINTWKEDDGQSGPCFFCGETTGYWHDMDTPICNECVNIYGTTDIKEKRKDFNL